MAPPSLQLPAEDLILSPCNYAAVVGFGGAGTQEAFDAVRLVTDGGAGREDDGGGRLELGDGTYVDLTALLAGLC